MTRRAVGRCWSSTDLFDPSNVSAPTMQHLMHPRDLANAGNFWFTTLASDKFTKMDSEAYCSEIRIPLRLAANSRPASSP
jgi:hypothetical protein